MEVTIKVEGMMCTHCKAMVEKVCKAVPGTVDAVVDLQNKQVTVTGSASVEALKKAITDAGYDRDNALRAFPKVAAYLNRKEK